MATTLKQQLHTITHSITSKIVTGDGNRDDDGTAVDRCSNWVKSGLDTVCLHYGETLAADGQFGTILGPDVCNGVIIPTCTNIAVPTKS